MSFGQPHDDLRYGSYLRIPELLDLQKPLTPEHDELQFIVVHQVYELWFKLILHELDSVMSLTAEAARTTPAPDGPILEARRLTERVTRIQGVLLAHFPILETMRAGDFLRFRDRLKPASGFQSVQFREVEFLAGLKDKALFDRCDADEASLARLRKRLDGPTMREHLTAVAKARGLRVAVAEAGSPEFDASVAEWCRLYEKPELDSALYGLAEAFCEFDENLSLWRSRHITMVERVIGGKIGTGHAATGTGYEGVRYLGQTLRKRAFPELWEVRTRLGEAGRPSSQG
jgi:tryptophan 2,3-dioxygenase